jgi:hypothetical protein
MTADGRRRGGTLIDWIRSPGAIPTLISGIPAAIGFVLGSLAANPAVVPPPLPPTTIYGTGTPQDPFRDYPDASRPPWMEGVYGKGTVDDPYRDYDYGPQEPEPEPNPSRMSVCRWCSRPGGSGDADQARQDGQGFPPAGEGSPQATRGAVKT